MNRIRRPGSRRGFTFVEMLIVLLVIAVILCMAVPAWRKIRQEQHARAGQNPPAALARP